MPRLFNRTPFIFTPLDQPASYGRRSASLIVKATFDIHPDAPATPAKDQRPLQGDTPHMDEVGRSLAWPSDLVPWKPNTDFFIVGSFHQPGGIPRSEGTAGFEFGPLRKRLRFIGPRIASRPIGMDVEWTVGAPEPVASIPLRWELSAGGLRDPRNPFGMGQERQQAEGFEAVRLPLIEHPLSTSQPANFAPVPAIFAERRQKLGTRDQRWSLFRAPLPPEDFDPSHVNAAPVDQQAGDSPVGNERIVLENLHPRHPTLGFFLPGLKLRAAVLRRTETGAVAEEIDLRIDTVVVIPDEDLLVMLWRGVVPLSTRDFQAEIIMAECCAEDLAAAKRDPDLPARLMQRWQAQEKGEQDKAALIEKIAFDQILQLLPKADLPPEITSMIENRAAPEAIFAAIEKHVTSTLAAIRAKFESG